MIALFAVLAVLAGKRAHAEQTEPERKAPRWISAGLSVARTSYKTWRTDAEVSGAFYSTTDFAFGAALGGNAHRAYAELQPAFFGGSGAFGLVAGLNPGVVIDGAGTTRVGGQLTLWAWPMIACCGGGVYPVPVFFGRGELLPNGHVLSFGLMLKLPIPFGS